MIMAIIIIMVMMMMMMVMMLPIVVGKVTISARRYPISSQEMVTCSSNTIHVTPSVQEGVVRDPTMMMTIVMMIMVMVVVMLMVPL